MDNRYAEYRQIRYNRTYKTLGSMNLVRIVLGILLLISVLFISGTVSEYFAAQGKYTMAEKTMLFPSWMEKYKPETKAYIDSGAKYESGDFDGAYDALLKVDPAELSDSTRIVFSRLCSALYEHFSAASDTRRADTLARLLQSSAPAG